MSGEIITLEESKRLVQLEDVVRRGLSNFNEVGEALSEIRDSRLYRLEYKSFDDYCREKWGISRVQAHRLTVASEIASALPIGNKPTAESQVRPLVRLQPEDRNSAWQEASANGTPTAKEVEAVVERRIRPITHTFTEEEEAAASSAESDSERLWLAKSHFKKLNKKERAIFIKWAQQQ